LLGRLVVDADAPRACAHFLAQRLIRAGRPMHVAFSGGRSPWKMVEQLVLVPLSWEQVTVWQVDERVAPDFDEARNWTHLWSRFAVPAKFAPIPVDAKADPEGTAAARRYAEMLGGPATRGVLDLVHLGLGDDGHTASLFPGDAALKLREPDAVAVGPYLGHRRVTLTLPALARARALVFLVTGATKRQRLKQLLEGDVRIPAGRLRHPDFTVFADPEAAGA
jgi:6-phosphogluconolactonase